MFAANMAGIRVAYIQIHITNDHATRAITGPSISTEIMMLASPLPANPDVTHNVELSGLRGSLRRSARLPDWASAADYATALEFSVGGSGLPLTLIITHWQSWRR
ncbi:MAG: hypothetical protein IPM40_08365 [Gammaproteobacteria bacterium]|jgi:hypothetical protein|nr:hypothetical protein [Gammaproteobacteria bacterium]